MRIPESETDEPVLALTALVDVVFLLLVFFLLSTTFLDPERELDVSLPPAESGAETDRAPEKVVLTVLADGSVVHGGRTLERGALVELLRTAAQRDPETPVAIRGDRDARHEAVVGVLDACGVAGLRDVSVGTTERGG